ncbi:MAG TPA: hypothetical protein DCP57_10010 [Gammaproteobacteria bacterium]|nr:hypothetical protein [Gammaproteobacteria bacterium]HBK17821.1 hypothetical protein [Gammaproteobacteria bacterium]
MAAALKKTFPEADCDLIPGGGGIFDVVLEKRIVFSKADCGTFPDHDALIAQLNQDLTGR